MIKIVHSKYIISAVSQEQWPTYELPEFCLAGRSNVGKSSFINCVLNRKALAKTSSTPGKTRTLNFYQVDDLFYFVDVPGYGYAKIRQEMYIDFGRMIESYLNHRPQLKKMFFLVDARHKPTKDDCMMYDYLKQTNIDTVIIATKVDKLKKNDWIKQKKLIQETLKMGSDDTFIFFSSLTRYGLDAVHDVIETNL